MVVEDGFAETVAPLPDAQQSVVLPGPDDTVTFTQHVKPLFRRMDRESMSFVFDLWSSDDVRKHAPEILRRLGSGTMPCDGAWPKERVGIFRRWIDSGMTD